MQKSEDEVSWILLLDGDIPKYTTAFACADETELWKVEWTAKAQMESVCALSQCSHYLSFLTDSKSNFRNIRATTWPYKGKRKDKPPVPWLSDISDYYMNAFGYQMMYGVEADDALTIAAEVLKKKGFKVACATKDKDLKQYPWDRFVDLNDLSVYSISEQKAHWHLWKQMLIGDVAVDNIPGLSHAIKYETTVEHNIKKRGAADLLMGVKTAEKLLDAWDPEDYPRKVYELYLEYYEYNIGNTPEVRKMCEDRGQTFGEYRFYETFDLIYMLRDAPKDLKIHYDYQKVPVKSKALQRVTPEFEDCSNEEF